MKSTIFGTMLAAAALTGCALDDNDETAGEAQQAVNSFGIWSWGCGSTCALTLGPAAGETCFLAGVWGNLQPAGSYSQVQVLQSGGSWGLQVVTNGRPLGGTAVCVPGSLVKTGVWHGGDPSVNLGSGATRRCFLSGVLNAGGGFTSASDNVQVFQFHGTWFLGGSLTASQDTTATAVCVDVPTASSDPPLVVGDGASALHQPIQSNNPGGWACGLKKLGGHFTANDYNDGIWIEYNNTASQWELNAVNGKTAVSGCVN